MKRTRLDSQCVVSVSAKNRDWTQNPPLGTETAPTRFAALSREIARLSLPQDASF